MGGGEVALDGEAEPGPDPCDVPRPKEVPGSIEELLGGFYWATCHHRTQELDWVTLKLGFLLVEAELELREMNLLLSMWFLARLVLYKRLSSTSCFLLSSSAVMTNILAVSACLAAFKQEMLASI